MPSTTPPGLGSLPSKASDKMHEKISLKKRNLQHPEIGLHSIIKPLPLIHNSPITISQVKVTILKLPKTRTRPTSRTFTTPLAACTPPCTGTLAALGSSIYPPLRLLAASAWSPSGTLASAHRTGCSFPESSPSCTSKSLGLLPSPHGTGSRIPLSYLHELLLGVQS